MPHVADYNALTSLDTVFWKGDCKATLGQTQSGRYQDAKRQISLGVGVSENQNQTIDTRRPE
jgi:hypothetical protein